MAVEPEAREGGIMVDELYRRYSRALLRFIGRHGFNRDEAADIVQETYCRMQQVADAESIEFPRAFLFRTARNLALNHAKRRGLGIEQAADVRPSSIASVLTRDWYIDCCLSH